MEMYTTRNQANLKIIVVGFWKVEDSLILVMKTQRWEYVHYFIVEI